MLTIFYARREEFTSSSEILKKILNDRFSIFEYEIFKNENGKPFLRLENSSLQNQPYKNAERTWMRHNLHLAQNG